MNKKVLLTTVVTATVIVSAFFYHQSSQDFNAEEIIQNSELKNRTFSADVKEIISDKHKIKAYLMEDRSNPIISISFIFTNAGMRSEPQKQYGVSKLAAGLMTEGAGKWNAQQFKEMADEYAVSISYGADGDDFSGQLLTTKENSAIAFEMLKQTMTHPSFGPKELSKAKQQLKAAIKQQQENPEQQLSLMANSDLFGEHPYGRNPLGNVTDIENLSAREIRTFIRNG